MELLCTATRSRNFKLCHWYYNSCGTWFGFQDFQSIRRQEWRYHPKFQQNCRFFKFGVYAEISSEAEPLMRHRLWVEATADMASGQGRDSEYFSWGYLFSAPWPYTHGVSQFGLHLFWEWSKPVTRQNADMATLHFEHLNTVC